MRNRISEHKVLVFSLLALWAIGWILPVSAEAMQMTKRQCRGAGCVVEDEDFVGGWSCCCAEPQGKKICSNCDGTECGDWHFKAALPSTSGPQVPAPGAVPHPGPDYGVPAPAPVPHPGPPEPPLHPPVKPRM